MTLLYITDDPRPSCRRAVLKCDDGSSSKCLREWSTRHLYYNVERTHHVCRNCNRKRYASIGGKAAATVGKENGQIHSWIMAASSPAARNKARRTAQRKGRRAFSSKIEDKVYTKCCEWFGTVKRWRYITRDDGKRCSIDMYVPSIDTYIEVDGMYWHGLDRPYGQLTAEPRAKYDHDRRLDEYCQRAGLRLIRVTEQEVRAGEWVVIQQRLASPCTCAQDE